MFGCHLLCLAHFRPKESFSRSSLVLPLWPRVHVSIFSGGAALDLHCCGPLVKTPQARTERAAVVRASIEFPGEILSFCEKVAPRSSP